MAQAIACFSPGGFGHPGSSSQSLKLTFTMTDVKSKPKSKPNRPRRPRRRRGNAQKRGDQKQKSAPVAQSNTNRTRKPKFETMSNGDCRITHREYVEDIIGGAGAPSPFSVQGLPINPGQKDTFQWLSKIAANYESYQFESLSFCYETEAPTSLGGTLLLAIDYDAADPAPISKQQAMAYRSSTRTAPWAGCKHRSLQEDLKKNKTNFVRIGAQPANTDIKTYDIGNLWVISQGISTTGATLGELYVEYTVKLMTPVYETGIDTLVVGGAWVTNGGETAANPMGTAPAPYGTVAFGVTLDNASHLTFAYAGTYAVTMGLDGINLTAITGVGDANMASVQQFSAYDTTGTNGSSFWAIQVNLAPSVFTMTATATTITAGSVYIGTSPTGSI